MHSSAELTSYNPFTGSPRPLAWRKLVSTGKVLLLLECGIPSRSWKFRDSNPITASLSQSRSMPWWIFLGILGEVIVAWGITRNSPMHSRYLNEDIKGNWPFWLKVFNYSFPWSRHRFYFPAHDCRQGTGMRFWTGLLSTIEKRYREAFRNFSACVGTRIYQKCMSKAHECRLQSCSQRNLCDRPTSVFLV